MNSSSGPNPNYQITLYREKKNPFWSETISFDDKGRLTINRGNIDDDWYLHVSKGEVPALKRVLDKTCKPRANSGDIQRDILDMLSRQFGESSHAFKDIEEFLIDRGIKFETFTWFGGN